MLERLYLSLLVVDLLRRFPKYFRAAQNYSHLTTRYPNYKSFKLSGSDLYNFIYFVDGDGSAQDKLKNPGAAKKMRKVTHLPTLQINGFLTTIANGKNPDSSNSLFINLESAIRINNTDYKNMRRAIGNFESLTSEDRKKNVTRLLYAVRAKLRSSDIIDDLEKLAVEKNFEVGSVDDNEPDPRTDITQISIICKLQVSCRCKKVISAKKTVELAVLCDRQSGNTQMLIHHYKNGA